MVVRRKRGCLPGHPKFSCLVLLEYYLRVPWASPSLGSFHSLFLHPSCSPQKLENFNHTKLNKTFVRSVSIIKQITTLIIVANPLIFLLHYTYCIITLPCLIPPGTIHRFIKISTQCNENIICQKQNNL